MYNLASGWRWILEYLSFKIRDQFNNTSMELRMKYPFDSGSIVAYYKIKFKDICCLVNSNYICISQDSVP